MQQCIDSYYPTVSGGPAAGGTGRAADTRSTLAHSSVPSVERSGLHSSAARKAARKAARNAASKQSRRATSRAIDEDTMDENADEDVMEEHGADVEDIEVTDNEQESEPEADSSDERFICNDEHDTTGCEQRARDADSDESESGSDVLSERRRKKRASDGRRSGYDSGDPDATKKKERSKQRDLVVVHERGRGDTRRTVFEYRSKAPFFLPFADVVTPWKMQQERKLFDFGGVYGRLAEGAFGSNEHATWIDSEERQYHFAQRFSVPVDETYMLKSVSTDVPNTQLDPRRSFTNSTAKVLHCIRVLHEQTELDLMEGKHYEQVFVGLQRSSRELELAMHGGPNGGLQGCAVDVLWRITCGEEASNVSDTTLRLLEMLSMAKQGNRGDELLHVTTTDRVDWFAKGKVGLTRVQCGVQMKRAYNFQEAQRKAGYCAVQDVDLRLVRKVWSSRHPQCTDFDAVCEDQGWAGLSHIVHARCQVNDPAQMGDSIKEDEHSSTDTSTLRLFLYKDVLPAWDSEQKQLTTVSIEGIYIIATSPANDPLLFLRSVAENNATAATLLTDAFREMRSVLGLETCTGDKLYGTDSVGAADVTPESRMVEGFFRFCNTRKLYNVQLGGMRMDVRDKAEMAEWKSYISCVTEARKAHYRLIFKETLHDRSHWREAHLPSLTSLDFFHGQMYWKISHRSMDKQILEYLNLWYTAQERAEIQEQLFQWRRAHISSEDETCMFMPVGEGWLRNSGIWIKIRMDNSKSLEEERADASRKKGEEISRWPQPQQLCRLVKIWLTNAKDRASGLDPLDVMLHTSKWIPDIEWMKITMPTLDEQHESIQWLFELIGDYALASPASRLVGTSPRLQEILQLVGKERNTVHKALATVLDSARLALLFRSVIHKINTSLKNALVSMQNTELKQWKIAALNINDLKKQNHLRDKWLDAYRSVLALEHDVQTAGWQGLLCSSTLSSVYLNDSFVRLDADVSYMNQLLVWLFICCTMAHTENRKGAYGMTLRIIDMAGTVDLLKQDDTRNGRTEVIKVTEKSPGAGADTTISFAMQLFVGYVSHISITPELKQMASMMMDTQHKQVSRMSFSTLQGSGVQVNSKREIIGTAFQTELSNNGHFTELFKNDEDQIAWMESLMAHSGDVQVGAESGVTQGSWCTTHNMENLQIERLKPLPVIVLTGNRPAKSTPASAVEGGRWMNIASSTQDKDNGFTIVVPNAESSTAIKHSLPCTFADMTDEERQEAASRSSQALLAHQMCSSNVRTNIKIVGREEALNNMPFFLLLQWLRRDAALMLSCLTHDAQMYNFCIKAVFRRVECSVGTLISGMRRDFLESSNDYWHRNANGPWARVLHVSMHVLFTLSNSMLAALSRASDGWPLDLHLAYILGIRCLMTNSMSIMSMLAALHLWLASAVLDYNFMIMCCFVYHFTSFQHTCPLRILSLVCRGHYETLTKEEQQQYLAFCDHIAPCVYDSSVVSERQAKHPMQNVAVNDLSPKTMEALAEYMDHNNWVNSTSNAAVGSARRIDKSASVYVRPRMFFCNTETIKGFGVPKDGQQMPAKDFNICGTPNRVMATVMAFAQKPTENDRRLKTGAIGAAFNSGTSMRKNILPSQDTVEFWKKVRKGTLLPEASTATNDMHKIKFDFVPYTGLWWDTTISNASSCDGIIKGFLLQSGLTVNTTVEGFFTKIMDPYNKEKHLTIHSNDSWKQQVMNLKRPFQLMCCPGVNNNTTDSVCANIAMSVVHYVLLQGLGVTADWNRTAHENAEFVSCVHLRNVSHMSLGILSMLLHTSIEKAMIPANDGHLVLPICSPGWNSQSPAVIEYDSRLHIDSTDSRFDVDTLSDASQRDNVQRSDNMLSIDSRLASKDNWTVAQCTNGRFALYYDTVIGKSQHIIHAPAHLFPFPPEAVAHTSDLQKYMAVAHKRFAERAEKEESLSVFLEAEFPENLFALAMLNLGTSIRFEEFQHLQPTLTDCVVRDKREIPCVTFEHAWLFTISFCDGRMRLRPVTSTHKWDAAADFFQEIADANKRSNANVQTPSNTSNTFFQQLPADEAELPSCNFAKFFRHGLKLEASALRVVFDITYNDDKRLPFYMFPVMHWPVLLKFFASWFFTYTDTDSLLCNTTLYASTSDHLYARAHRVRHFCSVFLERLWLQEHCANLFAKLDHHQRRLALDDMEIFYDSEESLQVESHGIHIWARKDGVRVHFSSVQQLENHTHQVDTSDFVYTQAGGYYMITADPDKAIGAVQINPKKDMPGQRAWMASLHMLHTDAHYLDQLEEQYRVTQDPKLLEQMQDYDRTTHHLTTNNLTFQVSDFSFECHPSPEHPVYELCWALTMETEQAFLHNGHYNAMYQSTLDSRVIEDKLSIDFITMSRCMVPEGTELWIRISAKSYAHVLMHIEKQNLKVMLPVSAHLHNNMPEETVCYLRCFYYFGGSRTSAHVFENRVSVICTIATKDSVPGKSTAEDDKADSDSRVNVNISTANTNLVSVAIPVIIDGAPTLHLQREQNMPFYKYLKER